MDEEREEREEERKAGVLGGAPSVLTPLYLHHPCEGVSDG